MARTNSAASTDRWNAAHYEQQTIRFYKGDRERARVHAAARGESFNAFIMRAIRETIERDTLQAAAAAAGMTVEEYTRRAALDKLKEG